MLFSSVFVFASAAAAGQDDLFSSFGKLFSDIGTAAMSITGYQVSESVSAEPKTCSELESSQKSYFDFCGKEGYDNVCLNKYSGEYQGCTRNSRNDCTVSNANAAQNILCALPNVTSTPACSDSDGGKDYDAKGSVNGMWPGQDGSETETDACCINCYGAPPTVVSSSDILAEVYCNGENRIALDLRNCTNGCSDGACIKEVPASVTKEQVKCVFTDSTSQQKCYSSDGLFSCSGTESCVVDVSGAAGTKMTWKSSCGGYAYTTIDGSNEYAQFKCAPVPIADETQVIKKYDYFAVSAAGVSYTLRYISALKSTEASPQIEFQDWGSGNRILLDYKAFGAPGIGPEAARLNLGGGTFRIWNASADTSSDFNLRIDLNGDGALEPDVKPASCSDSDSGKDYYYVKGNIKTPRGGFIATFEDKCVKGGADPLQGYYFRKDNVNYKDVPQCSGTNCYLAEAFCDAASNQFSTESFYDVASCPLGCSDGACITKNLTLCTAQKISGRLSKTTFAQDEKVTLAIKASDAQGKPVVAKVGFSVTQNGADVNGAIDDFHYLTSSDTGTVTDVRTFYYAPGNYALRFFQVDKLGGNEIPCSAFTSGVSFTVLPKLNGTTCTDSDGGKNYYKKGTVTAGSVNQTDFCVYEACEVNKPCNYNGYVEEYFCGKAGLETESFTCPNGCNDGACIPAAPAEPCPSRLELEFDKDTYNVGDTGKLTVRSYNAAGALQGYDLLATAYKEGTTSTFSQLSTKPSGVYTQSGSIGSVPGVYTFTVKQQESCDSSGNMVSASKTLTIVSDEAPPENHVYDVQIKKGWNLVGLLPLMAIRENVGKSSSTCSWSNAEKVTDYLKKNLFGYDAVNKKYMQFTDGMVTTPGEGAYLVNTPLNGYWLRSTEDCSINMDLSELAPDNEIFNLINKRILPNSWKFVSGWNFFTILPEMEGKTLDDVKGSCEIKKAYTYNRFSNSWVSLKGVQLEHSAVGNGFVLKVSGDCVLGESSGLPPPLPEGPASGTITAGTKLVAKNAAPASTAASAAKLI